MADRRIGVEIGGAGKRYTPRGFHAQTGPECFHFVSDDASLVGPYRLFSGAWPEHGDNGAGIATAGLEYMVWEA